VSILKILTFNIDAHPKDRLERVKRVTQLLDTYQPDIVLLQETIPLEPGFDAAEYIAANSYLKLASNSNKGTAILSIFDPIDSFSLDLAGKISRPSATFAKFDTPTHPIVVCSAHLSWGSAMEVERLTQVMQIEEVFARYGAVDPFREGGNGVISFLGGDLNATPEAASIKWLKGLSVENSSSTHWTDAWVIGNGAGYTSDPENPLLTRTAESSNIGNWPEAPLPKRRIDYLFSRGFAYGRAGAPLEVEVISNLPGHPFPSDHYALLGKFSF
jgi:endonuclease/exonuclease/phosphatase family metal-dependent hydrolase